MELTRYVASYASLRGSLWVLNGSFGLLWFSQWDPIGAMSLALFPLLGFLLLMAAGGLMTDRYWSKYLAIPVLAVDGLFKGAQFVLSSSLLTLVWAVVSLCCAGYLLLGDPFGSSDEREIEAYDSAHQVGTGR